MKTILLTISAVLISVVCLGQSGINYKAQIKDDNGDILITQAVTMQFQILEDGTTNVYQETHTPTTDVNGVITVNIGEGTVDSGNFLTIDWGAEDHFLNVQVNTGSGFVDLGTTQFTSVPYAKMADKAISLVSNETKIGDVKTGFQSADHDGWIKLDGRSTNTLTASQQNNANFFGFSANLPNATNSVLMQKSAPLGTISGSNNLSISRTNLPNYTLNGTTSVSGIHNHDFVAPDNDANSSESQGYPLFNSHRGLRTTNLSNGLLRDGNVIRGEGNHVHSISIASGGSGVPIALNPQSLNVNVFIYLGN